MRYYPAALALSLLAGVSASTSYSAPPQSVDPRAASLMARGEGELAAGRVDDAVNAYEAALTVQPGNVDVLLGLAAATRRQGMQGKALHYYRAALVVDPQNLAAISGEGAALVEKGAVEKARRNLTRLQGLCGCQLARQPASLPPQSPRDLRRAWSPPKRSSRSR